MRRHVCASACAVWLLCLAAPGAMGVARADKLTDAEELFRRAKALMTDNKFVEACPLLEESERLDPQMGTLLNLAICHESVGRIASAWGEFRAVEQLARAANRDDRVKLAHERAARLEPRLSRLKIVAGGEARAPGLVVKVDGEAKGEPLWPGVAVDTGTRIVEASAPGKKPAALKVKIDDEGATVTVQLPRLEDAPRAEADPAHPMPRPPAEPDYEANRSRRNTGIIVDVVGAATVAAGAVFGVLAIGKDGDARNACPQPCIRGSTAAHTADGDTDRAFVFANVSNVVLPLGLIAAAVGTYLIVTAGATSPSAAQPPSSAQAFASASLRSLRAGGLGVHW